jgi:hypothetical protein
VSVQTQSLRFDRNALSDIVQIFPPDKLLPIDSTIEESAKRKQSFPSLEQRKSQLSLLENLAQKQEEDAQNELYESTGNLGVSNTMRRRKNSLANAAVTSTQSDGEDDSNISNVSKII